MRIAKNFFAFLLVTGLLGGLAQAEEYNYLGTKKCKKCHMKQWKSWKETKMAKAFEDLKPGAKADAKKKAGLDAGKDYTKDPECLGCHTVGYGKPGGFQDEVSTPNHLGVGCEMCHGPGGGYTQQKYMSLKNKHYKLAEVKKMGLIVPPEKEQCAQCHNEKSPFVEKGYVFDYEKNKKKGTHEHFKLKYKHE